MTQYLITNFDKLQVAFRNSDGYAVGTETDPDSAAAGTTTGAYLVDHPVTFTPFSVNYRTVEGFGGGRVYARQVTGIAGFDNGSLQVSDHDDVLETYFNNTSVDTTTNSNYRVSASNSGQSNPPRMVALFTVRVTNVDTGATEYLNRVVLNTQFTKTPNEAGQGDGQNPSPRDYTVTPSFSNRNVFGQLWSASNITVDENRDMMMDIVTPKPLALTTFVQDGTATSFTLPYLPTSSTVGDHFFFNEGTDYSSSVSAVNTGTGEVTITAGTSGDILIALTLTDFVASA